MREVRVNHRFQRQSGFTLVEILVVTGVVTLGFLAAGTAFYIANKHTVAASATFEMAGLSDNALASLQRVVRDVGPGANEGICTFMKTDAIAGGAVGRIEFDFGGVTHTTLDEEWNRAFDPSIWQQSCEGTNFRRCYKPKDKFPGIDQVLRARNPEVVAEIQPVKSRNLSGNPLDPLPIVEGTLSSRINARDVSILMTVMTSLDDFDRPGQRKQEKKFSLMWGGEFVCRYVASTGATLLLNPSAIGTGIDSITLFSDVLEDPDVDGDLLNVTWEKQAMTEREINSQGLITRNLNSMKVMACSERTYRCPSDSDDRQWYDGAHLKGYVRYNVRNEKIQGGSVQAKPQLCLKGGGGVSNCLTSQMVLSDKVADLNNPVLTYDGSRRGLVIDVTNANESGFCKKACESTPASGIKYNAVVDTEGSGSLSSSLFRPVLRHSFPAVSGYTEDDVASEPVGCVCCFTKQCERFGLNVGPCHKQPGEPMDSRIPECASKNANLDVNVSALDWNEGLSVPLAGSSSCVSAEVSGSGKLILSRTNCSERLPALCYHLGRFTLSRNVNQDVVRGDFNSSNQACYDLSHEILNGVSAFESMLRKAQGDRYQGSPRPPVVADKYDFKNHAIAGIFLAPQTSGQIESVLAIPEVKNGSIRKFWIAFMSDSEGYTYAAPPLAASDQGPFLVHYEGPLTRFARRANLVYDTSSPEAAILAHSRDHYGMIPVRKTQTIALPVLCTGPGRGVFLTAARTTEYDDADDKCIAEGGEFLPPMTPQHWMRALQLVARIDQLYPWPGGIGQPAAWVGLRVGSGGNVNHLTTWDLAVDFDIGADGVTRLSGENADGSVAAQSACLDSSRNVKSLEIKNGNDACANASRYIGAGGSLSLMEKYWLRIMGRAKVGPSHGTVFRLKKVAP